MKRLGTGSFLGLLAGLVAAGLYASEAERAPAQQASAQETVTARPPRDPVLRSDALLARATPAAAAAAATVLPSPGQEALLAELRRTAGGEVRVSVSPETGAVRFLKAPAGAVLLADRSGAPAPERARTFLARYGELVGMSAAERAGLLGAGAAEGSRLQVARVEHDALGETHVRYSQSYKGLPVFGAELVVHLNEEGVTGTSGTFIPGVALAAEPRLDRAQAVAAARAALASEAGKDTLAVRGAQLAVYRTGLLEGYEGRNALAYATELEGGKVHEQVWVDATSGEVLNRIPLRHSALHRIVYSPEYDPDDPETFVQRREGESASVVPSVNNLYDFAGQTYNLFASAFGRDSYDGAGAIMRSVYLVNGNCPNAYWNGQSTNYCPGFDLDDVVAHEWGHAYTEYTHGLIYSYQSGALNESYSDIYGETLDLLNQVDGVGGSNNAQAFPAGQRWLVGEDLSQPVHEALLRDMWNPERLGDPAKVSSTRYRCGTGDNGGVHYNSGVPNHAFVMLVDGKSFNGQTVRGIGLTRALAIYWRAASVYQTKSSNFAAHADALEASCQDLKGQPLASLDLASPAGVPSGESITQADCDELAKAILATELRTPPTQCNFKPQLDPNTPAQCTGAVSVHAEGFEQGLNGWTSTSAGLTPDWPNYNWTTRGELPAARPGQAAFALNSKAGTCAPGGDHTGRYSLTSPVFTVPSGATALQARFTHYVETELNYDGGNVRISVNGGAFTLVPPAAYLFNAPTRRLADPPPLGQNTNPKAGELAWHGADGGETTGSWGTTLIALSQLVKPGDTYQLQFDFGIDGCNGVTGWFVDDVQVYDCSGQLTAAPTARFTATPAPAEAQQAVTFDGAASTDNDAAGSGPAIVRYTWDFGDGSTESTTSPTVQHVYAQAGTYQVSLTVTDNDGEVSTLTQALEVRPAPVRKADLQVQSIVTEAIQHGARVVVTVVNTGNADAAATRTLVQVDGQTLGELDTAALPAGGSTQVSVDWDVRGMRGTHELRATADAAAQVDEHDESNNSTTRLVEVRGTKVK